jgi:Flp pilus assembly pilin Flp
VKRLILQCERGAAAIEYSLIIALLVLALVQGAGALGSGTGGLMTSVNDQAGSAMGSAGHAYGKAKDHKPNPGNGSH